MHDALLDRIGPVTRRLRRRRLTWWWAIIAIVASLVGAVLLRLIWLGQIDGPAAATYLVGGTLAALLVAALLVRSSYRNPRQVALQIEQKFPSLKQRLLTALSQTSADPSASNLGYLQRRVIREARDHSRTHRWTEAANSKHPLLSTLCSWSATGCWVAVLVSMLVTTPPYEARVLARSKTQPPRIIVEPGNTEIERGSSLVVSARFENLASQESDASNQVPGEGELRMTLRDGSQRVVTLSKSLNDPVIAGFVASVDQSFDYRIVTDRWESEPYRVEVFEFPALLRSDARLVYPAYTGMEEKLIEDTVRIAAVEGTLVTWICYLNKPVATAELVSQDGERKAMTSHDGAADVYSFEMELSESTRMTLVLSDTDGRTNKYPPELVVRVLPNQLPTLKLKGAGDVSVSPLEELPLAAEVQDDFGIQRAGLSFTFADQPPQEIELANLIGRGQKQSLDYLLAFEDLGAEPDQLLAYYFWAEDFGPDGQTRRSDGEMFFAEVRPFEEIFREGEPPPGGQPSPPSENAQEAEELAELQKQIISATWNVLRSDADKPTSERFKENVGLIEASQTDAMGLLDELAGNLDDAQSVQYVDQARSHMQAAIEQLRQSVAENESKALRAALAEEQSAYAALLKLRAREFQVSRQQRNQQNQSSSSSSQQRRQQQLDELELNQDENRYETQQQADQSPEAQQQREVRQVLNRLRDLARRQADLNKQLAQLQTALEQAVTAEEKEEVERQLKRLRDQQQDLLRETDELNERMQQPENQEAMAEASEQLEQTRENVRQAGEALQQNDASQALTSGKRAEREFEEMRDEFRRKAAGQFNEDVRQMRNDAQELDRKQAELANQMSESEPAESPGLRRNEDQDSIQEALQAQQERLAELLKRMQQTVEEAEDAEPLLAQQLYDSFRKAQQRQIEQRLEQTEQLFQQGFKPQARELEKTAGEGISQLREDVERAATSVLGNETQALQRALAELNELQRALDAEMDQQLGRNRSPSGNPGDSEQANPTEVPSQNGRSIQDDQERPEQDSQASNEPPSAETLPSDGQPRDGQPRDGQPSDGQPSDGQPSDGQPSDGQPSDGQPREGQPREGQPSDGQPSDGQNQPGQPSASGQPGQPSGERSASPGSPQPGLRERPSQANQRGSQQSGSLSQFAADSPADRIGAAPLTGDGFREWTDRLREVEEMVEDPELRSEAARIRDRAREIRIESRRHSKEPQWELVEEMIAKPLRELKREVQEELIRRSAEKNAAVPIDRDPVPDEYAGAVERYYESLGSGR